MRLPTTPGGWPAIEADPPWNHKSRNPENDTMVGSRAPARHYQTMELHEICAMPVREIAAPNSHLFLWTTGPFLEMSFQVMHAWGFEFSAMAFVWVKLRRAIVLDQLCMIRNIEDELHMGPGYTTRKNAEFVLLGRRGNARRRDTATNVREIIMAPRREYSRKPDECYSRIEQYCEGPYLSLFSRQQRPGWTVWGNETNKFEAAQ